MASETLTYSVEEWTLDRVEVVEVLARAAAFSIAVPAYQAARLLRPHGRVILRQGARIIRDSMEG